jgi:hypothetical protein
MRSVVTFVITSGADGHLNFKMPIQFVWWCGLLELHPICYRFTGIGKLPALFGWYIRYGIWFKGGVNQLTTLQ